jgi:tetratricopeptide (TPR) repeat protein
MVRPSTAEAVAAEKLIFSGQQDAAEKQIVAHLAKSPHDAEWITLLSEVRINQGREREAVTLLLEANQIAGASSAREMLIGIAQCMGGSSAASEPQFRQAIAMDPFSPAPHYFLARLLYSQKRYDEAIQESKNAFSLDPDFVRAYENLGLCYEGKRQMDEAKRWFKEAIRVDAGNAHKTEWPSLDLATMLIRENKLDEAKPYLEQAVAINPGNAQTRQQLGLLKERQGDDKGALDEFLAAIQADSEMDSAYYQAARISRKLGDNEQAAQLLAKFQKIRDAKDGH